MAAIVIPPAAVELAWVVELVAGAELFGVAVELVLAVAVDPPAAAGVVLLAFVEAVVVDSLELQPVIRASAAAAVASVSGCLTMIS
ncbi:MAG: hypothetical protein ACYDHN_08765 [Solirubrobacteraceae bacterium]